MEIESFEVPEPGPGQVLVRIHRTQVSAGTEISWFFLESKHEAKQRRPLGYTAVGHVLAVGPEMDRFKPGDRVLTSCSHSTHGLVGTGFRFEPCRVRSAHVTRSGQCLSCQVRHNG